jgi:anti-anti-sigma factor
MRIDRGVPADAEGVLSVSVGPVANVDLTIRVSRTAVAAVIAPEGEIDSENARQLDAALRAEEAHDEVVLDLRGVSYMSPDAVAVVDDAYARSEQASWDLRIVRGSPAVQRLLEDAGLARRAPMLDGWDGAGDSRPASEAPSDSGRRP